jgi:hypothetical protein
MRERCGQNEKNGRGAGTGGVGSGCRTRASALHKARSVSPGGVEGVREKQPRRVLAHPTRLKKQPKIA